MHKNKGFTLIEILIALGLTTFVAAILAGALTQLNKSQKSMGDQNDALRFYTSLESFLLSNPVNCTTALGTQAIPTVGAPAVDVHLNNFIGFVDGTTGGTVLQAGSIVTGNTANQRLRVKTLQIEGKPSSLDVPIVSNGVSYTRRIARLDVTLEKMDPNNPTVYNPLPTKYVEVPVYVAAGNVISTCAMQVQQTDICAVMGATYNSTTQQCIPASQCIFKGSYSTASCSPAYASCAVSTVNVVTGSTSCPTGVTPQAMGSDSSSFTVSCGKKCSTTINQTIKFYICLDCS